MTYYLINAGMLAGMALVTCLLIGAMLAVVRSLNPRVKAPDRE